MYTTIWIILGAVLFVGYTAAVFGAGGDFRDKHYWPLVPQFAPYAKPDMVTPVRFHEHETVTGSIELPPIELAVTTSPLLVLSSPRVHEASKLEAALARVAELEDTLAAKDEDHAAEIEALTVKYERAEHLRKYHLHNTRIARARYNRAIVLGFEQKRRPTCEKVLAEVIPIGTRTHPENVRLITPLVKRDWVERELVAA